MNLLLADLHKFVGYSGGIEHVLSRMALAMQDRDMHVSVVMADEKDGAPFYPFPEAVPFYNIFHYRGRMISKGKANLYKLGRECLRPFSRAKARNWNYKLLSLASSSLKDIIDNEKPDVIISFREPTGRLLLDHLRVQIPVISMLHNDPDEIFRGSPEEERKALLKSRYIQVLMPSFIEKAKKYLPYGRFVYIPNTVDIPSIQAHPGEPKKTYTILNVGRVTGRTKRQHLLIEAFALLAPSHPDWQVEIWGDTYDKIYVRKLHKMIEEKGLSKQIRLMGTTREMEKVLAKADIFAFPSHHEGFPLALTEALGAGIPAVGYKECSAVNELIQNNVNGFLTDSGPKPFAKALQTLMDNAALRRRMGKEASRSMKPFAPDAVWDQWTKLIQSCSE